VLAGWNCYGIVVCGFTYDNNGELYFDVGIGSRGVSYAYGATFGGDPRDFFTGFSGLIGSPLASPATMPMDVPTEKNEPWVPVFGITPDQQNAFAGGGSTQWSFTFGISLGKPLTEDYWKPQLGAWPYP
jgi:hypothetical protein